MTALTIAIQFNHVTVCCACGTPFMMSDNLHDARREDHRTFHCPNGHPQHFPGKTEADRLRAELEAERKKTERERQRREWAEQREQAEKRSHAATKGAVTKIRKRVANGVCPCCNRTFKNLARHMQTKHPNATLEGES